MYETATLHFDLSHLAPGQPFTLHAGSRRYELSPHNPDTLARARLSNGALARLPDERITHFSDPVSLPGDAPMLLRVTSPRRGPDDLLDRLVLTGLHIPRRHRAAALARRRASRPGEPLPLPPKLVALGVSAVPDQRGPSGLWPDAHLVDLDEVHTPMDAAVSIIFHHTELLTTKASPASDIVGDIHYARGLTTLADSITSQSGDNDSDSSQPNWVSSQPGWDWKSKQSLPDHPIYVWSCDTLANMKQPLADILQTTKDDLTLQNQCWTVQDAVTFQQMKLAPATPEALGGEAEAIYTIKEVTPQSGVQSTFDFDPASKTGTVNLSNSYLRWLTVSVDQYDSAGKPVGMTQLLGQASPVDTIMAVPILPPDPSPYPFTFADTASRARVTFGGLGQPPFDPDYDGGGIVLTAVFNYGIPAAFIALGVAVDQIGTSWTDLTKKIVGVSSAFIEAALSGPLGNVVTGSDVDLPSVTLAIANCAGALLTGLLTEAGTDALKEYLAEAFGQSTLEDAEPFIGWAALAVGAAADTASIIETSVEVARSPALMSIDITRTMDVQVTIGPDSTHAKGTQWPATATHYVITITYEDGPVYIFDGPLDAANPPVPLVHTFTGLPAGGNITILAAFYAASGWQAGQAVTSSMTALPTEGSTLVVPEFRITENKVPLTSATTYSLMRKLGFNAQQGHVWLEPPAVSAPTATSSDLDPSPVGNNLATLGSLTVNQESGLGYLWEASGQNVPRAGIPEDGPFPGQIWTFQTLSGTVPPSAGLKFTDRGYTAEPCIAFPPPTMPNPAAPGFLLEPDVAHSVMHLRALSLTPGQPLIAAPGQSFGRFTFPQDDLAIHPAGYAVALDMTNCKLQVVRLTGPSPDASAPSAAILSGQGTRPGLLSSPVAVACSLDKIVVLQSSAVRQNSPIQYPQGALCALDFKGNPVKYSFATGWMSPLHPEGSATVQVLDLSIESKGYLYVLKCLVPASGPVRASDYRLDIYNPDGTLLTQVAGLAAARLQVDLWRNVFTLNYEIVPGSGRTEPSIAEWIPSTPAPGGN